MNPCASPTFSTREGRQRISKCWTGRGRSFRLNSRLQRRAAPSTRVSCNFTGPSAEAGSNSRRGGPFAGELPCCPAGERKNKMTDIRKETDSLGEGNVPAYKLWGAQTHRSLEHFSIGKALIPTKMSAAYAILKQPA